MLHLKPHQLHIPNSRSLQLSPVATEDDELIQAIENSHEEPWQLEPVPDSHSLAEFWSGVEEDIANDPTWFNFATDEDQ